MKRATADRATARFNTRQLDSTVLCHRPDESTNLSLDPRTSRTAPLLGDLRPVAPESIPIPFGDGLRLDKDQPARPPGPRGSKCDPEGTITVIERWAWSFFLECGYLLSESQVFDHEVSVAAKNRPDGTGAE